MSQEPRWARNIALPSTAPWTSRTRSGGRWSIPPALDRQGPGCLPLDRRLLEDSRFENMIIYELHVGTFVGENDGQPYPGNLKKLLTKLDYIKSTGANMIELLPMHEVPGPDGANATPYLGYAPTGLFAVESSYSSNGANAYDDLKELVNAAHEKGLGVILDVVYNHFSDISGRDNWYWNYDGEPERKRRGNLLRRQENTGGRRRIGNAARCRNYVEQNCKYWVREIHLDGLRWDATSHIKDKPNGWEAMRDIAWSVRRNTRTRSSFAKTSVRKGNGRGR